MGESEEVANLVGGSTNVAMERVKPDLNGGERFSIKG